MLMCVRCKRVLELVFIFPVGYSGCQRVVYWWCPDCGMTVKANRQEQRKAEKHASIKSR